MADSGISDSLPLRSQAADGPAQGRAPHADKMSRSATGPDMAGAGVARDGPGAAIAGPRPWLRAALWLAFMGPFFFISYGFANWWSSRLPHVDSFYFAWEKAIPFWDWTILPYMSIDVFYAGSLFLCTSRAELDTHARRLLAATLISVCGFLLFPLQFSFIRPATSGFNGYLFQVLSGFDQPFNQAPSLHISLLMLLWARYAGHWRGWPVALLHGWFFLIGISVFTTWQHHVIDGVWGMAVGVWCFYLFPDAPAAPAPISAGLPDSPRRRQLALRYMSAAVLCWSLACYLRGAGWLLLWPAMALLLVALAYAHFGVAVFQKRHGRLSVAAQVLLAPYRLGSWLCSRWFSRRDPVRVEVIPGLCIGRAPGRADWHQPQPTAVLDLTAEFNASRAALALPYANVPMLDLAAPALAQLQAALAALHHLLDCVAPQEKTKTAAKTKAGMAAGNGGPATRPGQSHALPGGVLVHCALGYSRSALVACAWLLQCGQANSVADAVAQVRAARPQIVLPPAFLALLDDYHRSLAQ